MRIFHALILIFCISLKVRGEALVVPHLTVHVPMRDGVKLPTDIYYPPGSEISNEYPCILLRLPGGRKAEPWLHLAEMAKEGYVIAFQDTRSALDEEGKTMPYISDGWDMHQDGFDTVEWLAKSTYTNGKVGTLGFSAAGITQLMLAPAAPSSLVCQYIGQAASSLYHHAIYTGGQLKKHQVESWLSFYARDSTVLSFLSIQPFYNDFWKTVDTVAVSDRVEVPALHYGGWFDPFIQGTIDAFVSRQEKGKEGARGKQKLLIGPWAHFWPLDLSLGDFLVPDNGKQAPIDISPKRWFDYYLKGQDNGVKELPAVTYYVMGPFDGAESSGNVWRHTDKWPIACVEESLYLTHEKKLSEKVDNREFFLSYESDPSNPVPTLGGRNLFLAAGPKDQRRIEERSDVLVFTTDPLKQDIEVTGKVTVKLYVTSNVADTDVVVRLTDVYPDGRSILLNDGICRTGVVHIVEGGVSRDKPQEVTVDLSSISIVFAKGHSIRVSIAGSNYPRYEKNDHVGLIKADESRSTVAKNLVHLGENKPSRIILPIVRKGNRFLTIEKKQ